MRPIVLGLLSILAMAPGAAAQNSALPQIIVTGEGIAKATPDRAWIDIGTESRSKQSKDAQQRNAEEMTAVQQKLLAFGIVRDAMRTTAIDLQPEFDFVDGKQVPRGYVARNTVEVRVDDIANLGVILDAAVNSGATNIQSLRFDVKDRDQLLAVSLQSAVKNAMSKAQAIAAAASRTVDRILNIEEIGGVEPVPMMRQFSMAAKGEASTPVVPGEIEIRAQVRLTAAIK